MVNSNPAEHSVVAKSILPDEVTPLKEWVIATIVGYIVNLVFVFFFGSVIIEMDLASEVLGEMIMGLCVASAQYYVLRKYSAFALRWFLASVVSSITLGLFLQILVSLSESIYVMSNIFEFIRLGRVVIPSLIVAFVLKYYRYKRPFILLLATSIAIVIVTSIYGFIVSTFSFIIEPFSFFSMIIKECIIGLVYGICTGLALQYIESGIPTDEITIVDIQDQN